MSVTPITNITEFRQIIEGDKPTLIDFWAVWSSPCRLIRPKFEDLSNKPDNAGIGYYSVDVDDQGDIAQEVGVRAMPTFMLFQKGQKVGEVVGANPEGLNSLVEEGKTL
ncbi:thioredoxin family protein [Nocardiopsis sp. LOL_012]|uniref:thioredoxin family protein n=1 Tax=Nocardiopsis sp. LOL_012 TaxID=3345409 RepID=UPI003A8AB485